MWAHLPNSGRLEEVLNPGRPVLLTPVDAAGRKTAYDLTLVSVAGRLVSADARLPNALVEEAIRDGLLSPFRDARCIRREVQYGQSRLDFALWRGEQRCFVEVKSVTLVVGGVALFPDAPTVRGRRHVDELGRAVAQGEGGAIIFVVQREDVNSFALHHRADPAFAQAVRRAVGQGVEVYAYGCRVTRQGVQIQRPLEANLANGG